MSHLHTITLFGRSYTFQVDSSDVRAETVVMHLTEELRRLEVSEGVRAVPKNEMALLLSAALNITSAYVELKSSQAALTEELNRRFQGLAARLPQQPVMAGYDGHAPCDSYDS